MATLDEMRALMAEERAALKKEFEEEQKKRDLENDTKHKLEQAEIIRLARGSVGPRQGGE